MKTKQLFYRLAIGFSMVFYSLLAQDGSKVQGDGTSQEQTGYEEVMLDHNELGGDNIKSDPVLNGLHPDYWTAELNESSDYESAKMLTFAKKIALPQNQTPNLFINNGNSGNVLGVRVFFPSINSNAYVTIKPEGTIVPFSQDGNPNPFKNKGLIENVSAIKTISSFVFGLNFPYTLSVNLKNADGANRNFPLGSLHYIGWKQLDYTNPSYLSDVRDRQLRATLNYPSVTPYYTFDSYVVTRRADDPSGNFVLYVSWLKVRFDKSRTDLPQDTIDHDSYWQIQKYDALKRYEKLKSEEQYMNDLIENERRKMNLPPLNKPTMKGDAATPAAAAPGATAPAAK